MVPFVWRGTARLVTEDRVGNSEGEASGGMEGGYLE